MQTSVYDLKIQIHQPQGGQTQHITTYCLALVIQIHQPQGGQTFILTNIHFLNINLDPLASGRLDPLRSVRWHQKAIQIHQPQGGQTCTASFTGFSKKFRSTSLREARRVLYKRLRYHRIIQIHQPQGGQTIPADPPLRSMDDLDPLASGRLDREKSHEIP